MVRQARLLVPVLPRLRLAACRTAPVGRQRLVQARPLLRRAQRHRRDSVQHQLGLRQVVPALWVAVRRQRSLLQVRARLHCPEPQDQRSARILVCRGRLVAHRRVRRR